MNHLISARQHDVLIINKRKRTCRIVDFAVLVDPRVKLKKVDICHFKILIQSNYIPTLKSICCVSWYAFFDPNIVNGGLWSICRVNSLPYRKLFVFYSVNHC